MIWVLVAMVVVGWLAALLFGAVVRHQQTLLERAWDREDWYREKLMEVVGLDDDDKTEVDHIIRVSGIN